MGFQNQEQEQFTTEPQRTQRKSKPLLAAVKIYQDL